jgi:hypothetical protein
MGRNKLADPTRKIRNDAKTIGYQRQAFWQQACGIVRGFQKNYRRVQLDIHKPI